MTHDEINKLAKELFYYTDQIEKGKDTETNRVEIMIKIIAMNEKADELLEAKKLMDYKQLTHFIYHYYRLWHH